MTIGARNAKYARPSVAIPDQYQKNLVRISISRLPQVAKMIKSEINGGLLTCWSNILRTIDKYNRTPALGKMRWISTALRSSMRNQSAPRSVAHHFNRCIFIGP